MKNLKMCIVCIIVFFGAAFAIMSFNEDVAVGELFARIYMIVLGKEHSGFGVLECSYGIGIVLGITVFYNCFNKKNKNAEPTPIELKMQQYEDDINTYRQQQKNKKGK